MVDTNELKQNLKELYAKIDYDEDLTSSVFEFIDSFDGTNNIEFLSVMMQFALILMHAQENAVKASGYDELTDLTDAINTDINTLSEVYRRIESGEEEMTPPLLIDEE